MEDQCDNVFNVPNVENELMFKELLPEKEEARTGIWEGQDNIQYWKFSMDAKEKLGDENKNRKDDQQYNLNDVDEERSRKKAKAKVASKINDNLNVIQLSSPKKKRLRRTASEISRNWKCDRCNKSYGSEGALKTHCKLKHPGSKKQTQSSHEKIPFSIPKSISSIAIRGANTHQISVPIDKSGYENISFSERQHYFLPPDHDFYILDEKYKSKLSQPPYTNQVIYNPIQDQKIEYNYYNEQTTTKLTNDFIPSGLTESEYQFNLSMASLPISTEPIPSKSEEDEKLNHLAYIPILILKIGEYIKMSNICGDLICCISFKERKFYWELLGAQSLSRIEIDFDNVSGLEIELRDDDITVIILQLFHPPKFWKGWKSIYQNIHWTPIADFTTGFASIYRQHVLHFVKSAISYPLNRLLEQEIRLKKISELGVKHENLFFDETRDTNFEIYNNAVFPIHK